MSEMKCLQTAVIPVTMITIICQHLLLTHRLSAASQANAVTFWVTCPISLRYEQLVWLLQEDVAREMEREYLQEKLQVLADELEFRDRELAALRSMRASRDDSLISIGSWGLPERQASDVTVPRDPEHDMELQVAPPPPPPPGAQPPHFGPAFSATFLQS